ncbi:cob(I)yrinic acid a,c-diamide adenosyltransferase [bacterium]|nr:cob(I)yrinic acid a,c-diamide adenosyltransferase [bacterium]
MKEVKNQRGLVHVYTGEGKGKTTAALGIALRAAGWGLKVCIIQFIKGYSDIGEAVFARQFPDKLTLKQFAADSSRCIDKQKVSKRKRETENAMAYAEEIVSNDAFDLVILDEINNAAHCNLIGVSRILRLIANKPEHLELILTGRNAAPEVIEAADYVTEMKQIKHPFERGIQARKGIDY